MEKPVDNVTLDALTKLARLLWEFTKTVWVFLTIFFMVYVIYDLIYKYTPEQPNIDGIRRDLLEWCIYFGLPFVVSPSVKQLWSLGKKVIAIWIALMGIPSIIIAAAILIDIDNPKIMIAAAAIAVQITGLKMLNRLTYKN